jgi:hypothetical protein
VPVRRVARSTGLTTNAAGGPGGWPSVTSSGRLARKTRPSGSVAAMTSHARVGARARSDNTCGRPTRSPMDSPASVTSAPGVGSSSSRHDTRVPGWDGTTPSALLAVTVTTSGSPTCTRARDTPSTRLTASSGSSSGWRVTVATCSVSCSRST